jgi:hypothetical protein
MHVPVALQTPEQHRPLLAQSVPAGAHWQTLFAQLPLQQSVWLTQEPPAGAHAHVPLAQLPVQQSAADAHSSPVVAHAHPPFVHEPEQQSSLSLQTDPAPPHAQCPPSQPPKQQSVSAVQNFVGAMQLHAPLPFTAPEQHDVGPCAVPRTSVGAAPGGWQQTASHHSPVSHSAAVEQPRPTDDEHWYELRGFPHASVSCVPDPEQHCVGEGGS